MLVSKNGERRTVTDDGHGKTSPVWSADGRYVFYAENRPNRVAYYITTESVTDKLGPVADAAGVR